MTNPYKFTRWDHETDAPVEVEVTPPVDWGVTPRNPRHLLLAIIGNFAIWIGLAVWFAYLMGWL